MTCYQINEALSKLVASERKITNEILELINIALETRAYLELGYSSMFDWLVKGFGYSGSAAFRRIEAARLIKSVPEASQKLSDGSVNLSTLCKVQTMIRQQEKVSGVKLDDKSKEEIVYRIENKSVQETEVMMFNQFPEIASDISNERHTVINENVSRVHINLSNEVLLDLQRAKEVLSHKFPEGRDADIIAFALDLLLNRMDPLRKKNSKDGARVNTQPLTAKTKVCSRSSAKPADTNSQKEIKTRNPISTSAAAVKRITFNKGGGACTFRDPVSGTTCGGRYQVQIEHIIPRAFGGTDDPSNLTLLCRQHNLLAAEKALGNKLMDKYRQN